MDIHNIMEDLVIDTVDKLFDAKPSGLTKDYCRCRLCRMDIICYALNRLEPRYVMSGRGLAYSKQDFDIQKQADVVSVVKEGWNRINSSPRHAHVSDENASFPEGPVFNILPISGRVFNGLSFEPLSNISISLFEDGELVKMIDRNWQNPYHLYESTAGRFGFWLYPVVANSLGEKRKFTYSIEINAEGFEKLVHFVEMELVSENSVETRFSLQRVHHLRDLYLFPK